VIETYVRNDSRPIPPEALARIMADIPTMRPDPPAMDREWLSEALSTAQWPGDRLEGERFGWRCFQIQRDRR
jgi:hypothetical protein